MLLHTYFCFLIVRKFGYVLHVLLLRNMEVLVSLALDITKGIRRPTVASCYTSQTLLCS